MWLVHGWQIASFPKFTNWLKEQAPGIIGNLNHSTRFVQSFQASLIQACHTCIATSLHALVPATGMPSLLSRVIDVVSINSASLLPVIYIHTAPEGGLTWSLLSCPCLEDIPSAVGERNAASGSTRWFGLHSGEHLVHKVHLVEQSFHLRREDRAYRLAVTVVDQAIQGDGSVRFTEKECEIDRLPYSPLKEGVCKFHVADGVGTNVDKLYGETHVLDNLLRLIRRHFAWGTGNLIYRAVANKFDSFVHDFEAKAQQYLEAAALARKQTASRWRLHECTGRLPNNVQRPRPLSEQVGISGGSRWLPRPTALEKQCTKTKCARVFSPRLVSRTGDYWPACSNRWRAHVKPGRHREHKLRQGLV